MYALFWQLTVREFAHMMAAAGRVDYSKWDNLEYRTGHPLASRGPTTAAGHRTDCAHTRDGTRG